MPSNIKIKNVYQLTASITCVFVLSCIRHFAVPWTIPRQAPMSMGFSRTEYWSGLPLLLPGDLPDLGTKPMSPALAGGFSTQPTVPPVLKYDFCQWWPGDKYFIVNM